MANKVCNIRLWNDIKKSDLNSKEDIYRNKKIGNDQYSSYAKYCVDHKHNKAKIKINLETKENFINQLF